MSDSFGTVAEPRKVTGTIGGAGPSGGGGRSPFRAGQSRVLRTAGETLPVRNDTSVLRSKTKPAVNPLPERIASPTARHEARQDRSMLVPLEGEYVFVVNPGAALHLRWFLESGAPIPKHFVPMLRQAQNGIGRPPGEAVEWGANSVALVLKPQDAAVYGRCVTKIRPSGEARARLLKAIREAFERSNATPSEVGLETAPSLNEPAQSERFLTPNFPADVRPEQNTHQG